jgi:hypothetical protein
VKCDFVMENMEDLEEDGRDERKIHGDPGEIEGDY